MCLCVRVLVEKKIFESLLVGCRVYSHTEVNFILHTSIYIYIYISYFAEINFTSQKWAFVSHKETLKYFFSQCSVSFEMLMFRITHPWDDDSKIAAAVVTSLSLVMIQMWIKGWVPRSWASPAFLFPSVFNTWEIDEQHPRSYITSPFEQTSPIISFTREAALYSVIDNKRYRRE